MNFFLQLGLAILFTVASAYLAYKAQPKGADAGTLDDLGNPRADEGSEIPKVFGTMTISNPQVVWFGDLKTSPIVEVGARRYGFFGPKSRTTIGYKYSLGIHFVPCLGPVDSIKKITIDKRVVFIGANNGGTIEICKPTLFGPVKREGGVVGFVDFELGEESQLPNTYLSSVTDAPFPAYRGVTSIIAKQLYIGNSPSIRPWEMRISRINSVDKAYNGGSQWLPALAPIFQRQTSTEGEAQFIWIGLDTSGSMIINGIWVSAQTAVKDLLLYLKTGAEEPATAETSPFFTSGGGSLFYTLMSLARPDSPATKNNIRLIGWNQYVDFAIERTAMGPSDYDDMIAYVDTMSSNGATNFENAYLDAQTFFSSVTCEIAKMLFITDGAITDGSRQVPKDIYASFTNVSVLGISIDLDPTDDLIAVTDRAIRVDGSIPSSITDGFLELFSEYDMNPAHILRELLISPDTGGSGVAEDAGLSFAAAAQTLYDEKFGISLAWGNTADRESFKNEVEKHIDAKTFIDRRTGKWEIKLIRNDYVFANLPVFDRSNVVSWSNMNFPEAHTLINQLTVVFNDPSKDAKTSITVGNPARILQADSRIISNKIEYRGINRLDLGAQIASRDLAAQSSPLLRGEFVTTYLPTDLNLGSPIVINNAKLKIVNKVVRIVEIIDGNITDNSTRVKFLEDKFNITNQTTFDFEEPIDTSNSVEPVYLSMVEETPYLTGYETLGEETFTTANTNDSLMGLLQISAGAPNQTSTEVNIWRDNEEIETTPFSPAAVSLGPLSDRADHVKVVIVSFDDLSTLSVGTKTWIDGERVSLVLVEAGNTAISTDYWYPVLAIPTTGTVYTITVSRGILDTSPKYHYETTPVLFYEFTDAVIDDLQTSGDVLSVQLQTIASGGVLPITYADAIPITFQSRGLRPYPPGDIKMDAAYASSPYDETSTVVVTWEHRDRLALTLLNHTEAGPASPEAGTTYDVYAWALDLSGDKIEPPFLETNVGSVKTYSFDTSLVPVGEWAGVHFEVRSLRDALQSLFNRAILMPVLIAPENLTQGAWYDVNDLPSMFQDTEKTTAVSVNGDPVGRLKNQKDTL
jgi:hypothetical protein